MSNIKQLVMEDEVIFWRNHFFNTKYAIRDVWKYETLIELKNILDDVIEDKENGGYDK